MARPIKALQVQAADVDGVAVFVVSGRDAAGDEVSLAIPAEGLHAAFADAPLRRSAQVSPQRRGIFGKWLTQTEGLVFAFAGTLAITTVIALWCFPAWLLQ